MAAPKTGGREKSDAYGMPGAKAKETKDTGAWVHLIRWAVRRKKHPATEPQSPGPFQDRPFWPAEPHVHGARCRAHQTGAFAEGQDAVNGTSQPGVRAAAGAALGGPAHRDRGAQTGEEIDDAAGAKKHTGNAAEGWGQVPAGVPRAGF